MSGQANIIGKRDYLSIAALIYRLREVEGGEALKSMFSLSIGCVALIRCPGGGF